MGIRFNCHLCNHPLHVKDFQANKRGKCPSCQGSFRVPSKSADYSIPLDPKLASSSGVLMPVPKSKATRVAQGASGSASEKVASGSASEKVASGSASEKVASGSVSRKASSEKAAAQTAAEPTINEGVQAAADSTSASTTTKSKDSAAIPQTSDIPASLLPHIDARWFVRPPSGGQYGPATTPMLVDWIAERRITADSFLWREGMESWLSAVEIIPERFGVALIAPSTVALGTTGPTSEVANDLLREATPGSMASSKAAVTTKKKRQQRQQWIVLGLLVTIALSLAAALIYILWRS